MICRHLGHADWKEAVEYKNKAQQVKGCADLRKRGLDTSHGVANHEAGGTGRARCGGQNNGLERDFGFEKLRIGYL